jgi:hypothetical protein
MTPPDSPNNAGQNASSAPTTTGDKAGAAKRILDMEAINSAQWKRGEGSSSAAYYPTMQAAPAAEKVSLTTRTHTADMQGTSGFQAGFYPLKRGDLKNMVYVASAEDYNRRFPNADWQPVPYEKGADGVYHRIPPLPPQAQAPQGNPTPDAPAGGGAPAGSRYQAGITPPTPALATVQQASAAFESGQAYTTSFLSVTGRDELRKMQADINVRLQKDGLKPIDVDGLIGRKSFAAYAYAILANPEAVGDDPAKRKIYDANVGLLAKFIGLSPGASAEDIKARGKELAAAGWDVKKLGAAAPAAAPADTTSPAEPPKPVIIPPSVTL